MSGVTNVDEIVKDAKEAVESGYDVYKLNSDSTAAAQAVRNATNLILMASLRVGGGMMGGEGRETPGVSNINQPSAAQLEKAVESARKYEGLADILWIRINEHPNSFVQDQDAPIALAYAAASYGFFRIGLRRYDVDVRGSRLGSGSHQVLQKILPNRGRQPIGEFRQATTPFKGRPGILQLPFAASRIFEPPSDCLGRRGATAYNGVSFLRNISGYAHHPSSRLTLSSRRSMAKGLRM